MTEELINFVFGAIIGVSIVIIISVLAILFNSYRLKTQFKRFMNALRNRFYAKVLTHFVDEPIVGPFDLMRTMLIQREVFDILLGKLHKGATHKRNFRREFYRLVVNAPEDEKTMLVKAFLEPACIGRQIFQLLMVHRKMEAAIPDLEPDLRNFLVSRKPLFVDEFLVLLLTENGLHVHRNGAGDGCAQKSNSRSNQDLNHSISKSAIHRYVKLYKKRINKLFKKGAVK